MLRLPFVQMDLGTLLSLSGHQLLISNDDTCDNGLAYTRATEPGHFTYKCQEMSEDRIDVIREVTFMITIHALDNSPISACLAKYVAFVTKSDL